MDDIKRDLGYLFCIMETTSELLSPGLVVMTVDSSRAMQNWDHRFCPVTCSSDLMIIFMIIFMLLVAADNKMNSLNNLFLCNQWSPTMIKRNKGNKCITI